MNVDALRNIDVDALDEDARAWRALSEALADCAAGLRTKTLTPIIDGAWQGTAADFAADEITAHRTALDKASTAAEDVSTALTRAAEDWRTAQGELNRAVTQASGLGLRITEDGTAEPLPGHEPEPRDIREMTDLARGALTAADAADAALYSALGEHGDVAALKPPGLSDLLADVPKDGTDPATVLKWWNGLSAQQRTQLVQWHPEAIGDLDGIPTAARHRANLVLLESQIELLTESIETIEASADKTDPDYPSSGTEEAERKLEILHGLKERLHGSWSNGEAPLYLLGFDPNNDGKIMLSVGNPDTADDVSVYVPGTTAGLWAGDNGLAEDLYRTQAMFESAAAKSDGDVASVLWLDYDAPDGVLTNAPSPSYAEKGGPELREFVDGLKETHIDGGAHTTLVAHSYGSRVVAEAALHAPGMEADIVSVAGTGFGLDDSASGNVESELGLDGDVYEATSLGDIIRPAHVLEIHGDAPGELPGTEILDTEENNVHGEYWNDDEKFMNNVGNVIAGQKDELTFTPELQQEMVENAAVGPLVESTLTKFGDAVSPLVESAVTKFNDATAFLLDEAAGAVGDLVTDAAQATEDAVTDGVQAVKKYIGDLS